MTVEVCGVEQREDFCDCYQGYPVLVCWSPFFNKNVKLHSASCSVLNTTFRAQRPPATSFKVKVFPVWIMWSDQWVAWVQLDGWGLVWPQCVLYGRLWQQCRRAVFTDQLNESDI